MSVSQIYVINKIIIIDKDIYLSIVDNVDCNCSSCSLFDENCSIRNGGPRNRMPCVSLQE